MYSAITGDRYVLYLPQAKENFDRLDGSLASSIESEICKFFDAFNPASIFDKPVTENVDQIKNDRTVMRAFASWWDGGDIHVLLVLAVYKKAHQDKFWRDKDEYERMAIDYREELDERREEGTLEESLFNVSENAQFRLLTE